MLIQSKMSALYISDLQFCRFRSSRGPVVTLNAGVGFAEQNLLSKFSKIVTANSRITDPIAGMFVLISIYFSWWF